MPNDEAILPWGHWLIPIRDHDGIRALVDDAGREWSGVRAAFWASLAMCVCSHRIVNDQLAILQAVLTRASEPVAQREPLGRIFGDEGSIHFLLYMFWLSQHGMVSHGPSCLDQVQITDFGRSVLRMIELTNPDRGPRPRMWFPEPERAPAPRLQRRPVQKLLPAPDDGRG